MSAAPAAALAADEAARAPPAADAAADASGVRPPGDGAGGAPADCAVVLKEALASVVDRPSLFLVRAAQATALRQLKAARKQLRDFNTSARVQLEGQLAALERGAAQLAGVRADLDAVHAFLRGRKQELLDAYPGVAEILLTESQADDDVGGEAAAAAVGASASEAVAR